jgi:hypothetical protein
VTELLYSNLAKRNLRAVAKLDAPLRPVEFHRQ